ncbi:MAG: DUF2804 domain-containing protein [Treponema sp.]|jgi:hypothetical protein|nr:DUF2804 domain-containing protein [Treponema sp.]
MAQNEILSPASVLDGSGWPQNFGWARTPCFFYDPTLVWAPRRRISESDRYIVFSPTHLVIFEIMDDGYLGYTGVSVISLKNKNRTTQIFQKLFPLGNFEMPPGNEVGAIRFRRNKAHLDFVLMEEGVRIIKTDIPKFGHHRSLRGELVLTEPSAAESLVTNMPWRREKSAFRYSRRSPWYIVEGVIQYGTTELVFSRGKSWGIFDWNRGVRPRKDLRYWASACGIAEGRQIGFSAGYSSADAGMGTENAFFVDGKLHKLDQVTFHVSPANWSLPWRFTSNDNRLEMTFTPHQERVERNRVLVYYTSRRQFCGFFSGKVLLDDGSMMEFQNITGFVERKKSNF